MFVVAKQLITTAVTIMAFAGTEVVTLQLYFGLFQVYKNWQYEATEDIRVCDYTLGLWCRQNLSMCLRDTFCI